LTGARGQREHGGAEGPPMLCHLFCTGPHPCCTARRFLSSDEVKTRSCVKTFTVKKPCKSAFLLPLSCMLFYLCSSLLLSFESATAGTPGLHSRESVSFIDCEATKFTTSLSQLRSPGVVLGLASLLPQPWRQRPPPGPSKRRPARAERL